jgi:hypothetical protein
MRTESFRYTGRVPQTAEQLQALVLKLNAVCRQAQELSKQIRAAMLNRAEMNRSLMAHGSLGKRRRTIRRNANYDSRSRRGAPLASIGMRDGRPPERKAIAALIRHGRPVSRSPSPQTGHLASHAPATGAAVLA